MRNPPRVITGEELTKLLEKHGVNYGEVERELTRSYLARLSPAERQAMLEQHFGLKDEEGNDITPPSDPT